jgi:MFS family permease
MRIREEQRRDDCVSVFQWDRRERASGYRGGCFEVRDFHFCGVSPSSLTRYSDCWNPDQRGKAVGIYSLAPLLGPSVGPIAGAFIAETTTWRWVFWSTSIAAALIQLSGIFFLPETSGSTPLKRKAQRLRRETGNEKLHAEFDSDKTLGKALGVALVRPFRLLATQPIIQVIAVYMAYLFGLLYLILSTFPGVWEGENVGIGGLNYLSLGIGFALGAQIIARISDRIYQRLKHRNNEIGRPEFRIPSMFVASALIPIGLFWYGWSVEGRVHWIMPNIGIAIFAVGSIVCLQCMQTYVIDSYARSAASGLAAALVLRSLCGLGFRCLRRQCIVLLGTDGGIVSWGLWLL